MERLRLLALAVGLVCIPLLGSVSADEFRAEARVDRDVIGVGERLILTIEVINTCRSKMKGITSDIFGEFNRNQYLMRILRVHKIFICYFSEWIKFIIKIQS